MILSRFDDAASAAAALAGQVIAALQQGLAVRGAGSLALAGGRTPLPLFHALRDAPLDWSRVGITLTDERWVDERDAASNTALLRSTLAGGRAAAAQLVRLHDGSTDAAGAAAAAWQRLRALPRPFDAVVLGMGEDAHTASLFPGADALPVAMAGDSAEDAFLLVPNPLPPEAPFPRITLGLARLLRARSLHLIVTGVRKREVLRAAQSAYAPLHAPISALLHAPDAVVHVHWSP